MNSDIINNRNLSWLDWLRILCCYSMIIGMISSRVVLSVSMIILFVFSLNPSTLASSWQIWKQSKFAIFSALYFICYLLSGLWSDNLTYWFDAILTKLPFLILPFAFITTPFYKLIFQKFFALGIAVLLLGVVTYSWIAYLLNIEFYNDAYHRSVSLPTTKYNDHIRFSLILVSSIFFFFYIIFEKVHQQTSKYLKIFLLICCIIFTIYLHYLSAKTGLLALYVTIFIFTLTKIAEKGKVFSLIILCTLGLASILSYQYIPMFKTKINYVLHEREQWRNKSEAYYTLSDNGRLISYESALYNIQKHPLLGVGSGDIAQEVKNSYNILYPEIPDEYIKLPHNQFLFSAVAIGIPLSISLVMMFLSPLFDKKRKDIYLYINMIIMFIALMVEAMLEIQFGIFVYLFFTLFWNQILNRNINNFNNNI